jgi:uncharacterized protein
MQHLPLLAAAGLLAGMMNAIAGGGSFVTFPALVFVGLPPVIANASSTVALFPGTIASAWAYRGELIGIGSIKLRWMLLASVAGGFCGALLLLVTPPHLFDLVIPWLLLLATLTFAFGARVGTALRRAVRIGAKAVLVIQFLISIYGGYFGGAVGLIMLAVWGLLTASINVKEMGPARTWLVSAANGAAVLLFIASGVVRWPETFALLLGTVAGGYGGARLGRRLPPALVRACVVLLTASITVLFFWRAM